MMQGFRSLKDRSGAAAVEFALVAPVLFLLAVGTAKFGLTLSNYVMLTEAVSTGARQLGVSRGTTTPWTATTSAVQNSAPSLVVSDLAITTRVNGTACASNTACATALAAAAGLPASVTATYPCDLTVMGINFLVGCTLSSTITERIE